MKRFLFNASVERAEGYQTFRVDAETEEEALAILKQGGGDIYASEVDVVHIGAFEFDQETSLTDFGDFPEVKP